MATAASLTFPIGHWWMHMAWHDLLFLHWRVSFDLLRPHVPASLEVETREGAAWIAVVPFRMSGIRLRGLPPLPGHAAFPELNVRTYVRHADRPGVWFFSLDAADPLAVAVARRTFHLNYLNADMTCTSDGEDVVYASHRTHAGVAPAEFRARYRPEGPVFAATPGSLEHWLTERYSLYAADGAGNLLRGDIRHGPWPLQRASVEIASNTMTHGLGVPLVGPPHVLFARSIEVDATRAKRVSGAGA